MTIFIYGLVCPLSGEVRYIGKSVNPEKRLIAHLTGARTGSYNHHTARWIRKIEQLGKRPDMVILQELEAGSDWREVERGWIASGLEAGWPLTNSTAGGEGLDYLSPEDHARWRKNHRAAMRRFRNSPAGKRHMQKMLAAASLPENIRKRSAAVAAAVRRPEYREKMREVAAEIGARPEVKLAKSAKSRSMWQDQKKRDALLRSFASDECKNKQSAARARAWSDPKVGAKLRAIHSSEEVRSKKAAAKAANWADPAYRAMMSERIKAGHARRRAKKGA